MTHNLNTILAELYALDASLQQHEPELQKIVTELLALAPDPQINEDFVRDLRLRLQAKAEILTPSPRPRWSWAVWGGATLTMIVSLSVVTYYWPHQLKVNQPGIVDLGRNGFGPLMAQTGLTNSSPALGLERSVGSVSREETLEAGSTASPINDYSASDSLAIPPAPTASTKRAVDSAQSVEPMPPLKGLAYQYKYDGPLNLPSGEVKVFRTRVNNLPFTDQELLKNFTGFSNLLAGNELLWQGVTLTDNNPFGYSYYLDNTNGNRSLSIYKNWEKWPDPYRECQNADASCYENKRLSSKDLPADAQLIALANSFAQEHGIDLSAYAAPVIDKSWQKYATNSETIVPEEIRVIYPLFIDGQPVYEEFGDQAGLTINVDLRQNKVSGLNYTDTRYWEQASYAVADEQTIRRVLAQGGRALPYGGDNSTPTEIAVEAPQNIMTVVWYSPDNTQPAKRLYVPALLFKVKHSSEDAVADQIIVPMVREILENNNVPIPLMKSGESASGMLLR